MRRFLSILCAPVLLLAMVFISGGCGEDKGYESMLAGTIWSGVIDGSGSVAVTIQFTSPADVCITESPDLYPSTWFGTYYSGKGRKVTLVISQASIGSSPKYVGSHMVEISDDSFDLWVSGQKITFTKQQDPAL